MKRYFSVILLCLFVFWTSGGAVDHATSKAALDGLRAAYPGVSFYDEGGRIGRIYGRSFGSGSSPVNTAEQFRTSYVRLLGVEPNDLLPESILEGKQHTQSIMYDRQSGEYKFTLVYYSQYKDGIPVYRADLRLLVRNEPGYPLVLASSALRNLGDFTPGRTAINKAMAENAARQFNPELVNFSEPRMVIWAGKDNIKATPALAMEIAADNGKPSTPEFLKWRLLVDAQTGEVLYSENMIVDVNVTGNVSGKATQGNGADICGAEVATAFPYARVWITGGNEAYADASGNFTITNSGSTPVTVNSQVKGNWFNVYNYGGEGDASLSMTITPPGPANFMHNNANTSEQRRAEVNGYVQANIVRDYTLTYNPTYPTIYNQHYFPVNVNLNETCNAYYDYSSINFFLSGGGCANSAFSTVIHHEYGHHIVECGGSGQDEYGEGMGDVMGVLITDDPNLAYGFYNNCSEYMRSADNTMQYPCSGEIHYCGMLLSGCVWSTRDALQVTHPLEYRAIISDLAINAVLLHTGGGIAPDITVDYLTLDDDDGNINNGTPHWNEICSGFGAHNMDCPALSLLLFTYPNGIPQMLNPDGGTTVRVEVSGIGGTPQPGTGKLHYNSGSGWVTINMNIVSPNVYDAVFPAFACGTTVHFYFSATTTTGYEVNDPQGAPGTTYSAISATGIIDVFTDDFSTNKGWTGYGGTAEWTRGVANGGTGDDWYGGPDPSSDHSPTSDDFVLGNDLTTGDGDYEPYIGSTYYITSPTINCTGRTGLTLTFYRWLGVEQPIYDHAYFQVYNGTSWITLYENSGTIDESAWSEQTYNVSAYANNNANFKIRFGLGSTDGAWEYCGWNIDDVRLWTYECGQPQTGTLQGTVTDGTNPISGVNVFADDGAGHTGSTNTLGNGTYSLVLTAGTYTVTYTHPSYQTVVIPGVVITANGNTTQNVVMVPNPASGTLQGTVTNITNGNPVANAQAYADDGAGHTGSANTNGSGFYTMSLTPGTYTVTYTHPSFQTAVVPGVVIVNGGTTTQDVALTPNPLVPTLSEWGMILMSLLLLAIGTVAMVKRRKTVGVKAN